MPRKPRRTMPPDLSTVPIDPLDDLPGEITPEGQYDDQDQDQDQDTPDPYPDAPPPPVPGPVIRRAQVSPAPQGRPMPPYLASLLALPGIDAETLRTVNPATAWARIESDNGCTTHKPLAFLAPDALETLQSWGFAGHTTFEVRAGQNGTVQAYFACLLPPLPEDDDQGGELAAQDTAGVSPGLMALLTRQQMELQALRQQMQAQATADPMASLNGALDVIAKITRAFAPMMGAMPAPQPADTVGQILDVVGKVAPLLGRGAGTPEDQAPPEAQQ